MFEGFAIFMFATATATLAAIGVAALLRTVDMPRSDWRWWFWMIVAVLGGVETGWAIFDRINWIAQRFN